MRRFACLFVALALTALPAAAQPEKLTKAERKARSGIGGRWTALGRFAVENGARSVAEEALGEARRWAPEHRLVPWLERKVAQLGADREHAEVQKRRARVVKWVTAELDKLINRKEVAAHPERLEAYYAEAFHLDPGNPGRLKRFRALVAGVARKGDTGRVRRLLETAGRCDPEGTATGVYLESEASIGRNAMLQLKAPDHPLQAYVLLPPKWSPKKKWPIAVYVDGASSEFEAAAWRHRRQLNTTSFIVVVPMTLSNAREPQLDDLPYTEHDLVQHGATGGTLDRIGFDAGGLASLLELVRSKFRGEDGIFLTGFSGGGMLVYWWLHHHPEQLRAAAPASANYYAILTKGGRGRVADGGPPVLVITGANDKVGEVRVFPQTKQAVAALEALGCRDLRREHLSDRAHEPFTEEVFAFFEQVRKKRR